jgi:hypothetical protein
MRLDLSRLSPRQLLHLSTHRAYRERLGGDGENTKLVLADMAKRAFIGRPTYRGDEREAAQNEGKRIFMLETLRLLGVTEEELLEQMQERTADDG